MQKGIMLVIDYIKRMTQSRGFGVQSPFAFAFLRDVICNPHSYYAYEKLDNEALPYQVKKELRFLFRLANYIQAEVAFVPLDYLQLTQPYIEAGCRRTKLKGYSNSDSFSEKTKEDGKSKLVVMDTDMDTFQAIKDSMTKGSLLVIKNINKGKNACVWQTIQADTDVVVTFDLGNLGLVFWNHDYCKQNYKLKYV